MACNARARQCLIEQLKAHTMQREYVAFVQGRSLKQQGTWRHWLQLSADELRQQIVPPEENKTGRGERLEAITHFEVLMEYPLPRGQGIITKLRLRLETGRKHQIRVQAAHSGLPLLGDRTYHPAYRGSAPAPAPFPFPRQALHAEVLKLEHPSQAGIRMSWTAELPPDLRQLEAALKSNR